MPGLLVRSFYALLRPVVWAALRLGFGLEVRGRRHVPRHGGVVLAVNHVSYLDPVVVAVASPRCVVFLARRVLFEVPVLGPLLRWLRAIPVDRGGVEVGLRRAVRLLRAGWAVVVFPEGGRQVSGALGTPKPGVGFLAASARVPVIPVLLTGTRQAFPPGARWPKPAKIQVAFGPEIDYPEAALSSEACERLAQHVTSGWQRLRDSQHTHCQP